MDLYARQRAVIKQTTQKPVMSVGHVEADLKEWTFSIQGAMGWAALGVILILGVLFLKGKYRLNFFSFIKKQRRRSKKG